MRFSDHHNRPAADGTQTLVGRDDALTVLDSALERAGAGKSSLLVIAGEPGVGKSRLTREAVRRAAAQGCFVLHGRAQEYDSSIAYAVLKDSLAALSARSLEPPARHALDELIDALDGALADGGDSVQRMPSPYALVTRLLRLLADTAPCVVVIDDAHLADSESLAALSLAIRHLRDRPLLALFATRPLELSQEAPFVATVNRLVELGSGVTLELGPLSRSDTAQLVKNWLGGTPDQGLVEHVFHQSRGNPLFAHETLRALSSQNAIGGEHDHWYLVGEPGSATPSQRTALLHRIFQQERDARRLARAMSVLGRVYLDQLPLLAQLSDLPSDALQRAFDRLSDSTILVRSDGGAYEFAHPLMAEVLYEDLGPAERRRMHDAVVRFVAAHPDGRMGTLERAAHAVEAAVPGDAGAIDTAWQAAAVTKDAAPLSSARWLQRVLDLLGPDQARTAEVLARQARAYWKGARPELAVDAGVRALTSGGALRQRTGVAATVVGSAYAMGQITEALALSERFGAGDDAPTQLLAQRSLILTHLGRMQEALRLRELAWSRATGDSREEQAVTYSSLATIEHNGGTDDRLRLALKALHELGVTGEDLPLGTRLSALESWRYVELLGRNVPVPQPEMDAATGAISQGLGWHDLGGQDVTTLARTQYLLGRWDAALNTVAGGSVALEFASLHNNLTWLRLVETDILVHRGEYSRARSRLTELSPPERWPYWEASYAIAQSRIDGAQHPDVAGPELVARFEHALETGWHDVVARALDALVDLALDHPDPPGRLSALSASLRRILRSPASKVAAQSASAAAAILDRDVVRASRLLADVERSGNVLGVARTHYLLAYLGENPSAHLQEAMRIAERLRAAEWTSRIQRMSRGRGLAVRVSTLRVEIGPSDLGSVDMRLIELVGSGLNNREIADAMHYSRKTIEAYLSRLYRKTGTRSRIGLLAAAREHGWLADAPTVAE